MESPAPANRDRPGSPPTIKISPPGRTFSVNLTGLSAARGREGDGVVSILSRQIRPVKWGAAWRGAVSGPPGSASHQVSPGPSCRGGGRGQVGPASTTPHVFRIRKLEVTLRFCQPPPLLSPALPIMHRGRNELP
ncbi:hypothetical protein PAMP_016706 [Pampus punctatissimus]